MKVFPATLEAVTDVARRMRDVDRREIFAGRFSDGRTLEDLAGLAAHLMAGADFALRSEILALDDGTPVASLGAWVLSPGVASVHMFATDDWARIWRPATRYCRKEFIPFVLVPNVHRAECRPWAEHIGARRWLRHLGFVEEGVARSFGKNGEDFIYMAWTRG
ncbi:MAG TPA: hypothetical protein PLJ34_04220 [Hyphomicrobiales bacterium]|nr:hypothetical protein [Hyphomicrobiales bacterium]